MPTIRQKRHSAKEPAARPKGGDPSAPDEGLRHAVRSTMMDPAIRSYLRHLKLDENCSPETIRAYASDLGEFAALLEREIGGGRDADSRKVDRLAVRAFLGELHRRQVKRSTVARNAGSSSFSISFPVMTPVTGTPSVAQTCCVTSSLSPVTIFTATPLRVSAFRASAALAFGGSRNTANPANTRSASSATTQCG
jgi:hypothetical protein